MLVTISEHRASHGVFLGLEYVDMVRLVREEVKKSIYVLNLYDIGFTESISILRKVRKLVHK